MGIHSLITKAGVYQITPVHLLLVSLDIDPVLVDLDLHMKYTVEVVPLRTYIVWFVIIW